MEAKGFVVPPGQGRVWEMAAGRSSALKLLGGETGESVMMFEETAPAGTQTTYHLHHDSDEVAYVLAGEITFKIGDEVTVGARAPVPSCRAGSLMPGKTRVRRRRGCCSFIPRPERADFSRSRSGCSAPISRLMQRTSEPRTGAIAGRSSGRRRFDPIRPTSH
jgi:hypothetical protein